MCRLDPTALYSPNDIASQRPWSACIPRYRSSLQEKGIRNATMLCTPRSCPLPSTLPRIPYRIRNWRPHTGTRHVTEVSRHRYLLTTVDETVTIQPARQINLPSTYVLISTCHVSCYSSFIDTSSGLYRLTVHEYVDDRACPIPEPSSLQTPSHLDGRGWIGFLVLGRFHMKKS